MVGRDGAPSNSSRPVVTLPGADAPNTCTPAQSASETVEKKRRKRKRRRRRAEVRCHTSVGGANQNRERWGGGVNHQALPFFSYRQERHYDLKGGGRGKGSIK